MVIVKQNLLYEGKTKQIYTTSAPDFHWLYFKDTTTGSASAREAASTGILNNLLTEHWLQLLRQQGIDNHMLATLSPREMMVKRLEMIPLAVVVHNVVDSALAQYLGLKKRTPLAEPVVELHYPHDDLGGPLINAYHVRALGLATAAELRLIEDQALRINQILREDLAGRNVDLVDIRLEFGRYHGEVLLGDEISLNTCSFHDTVTNVAIQLGQVETTWEEIYRRLTGTDPILD